MKSKKLASHTLLVGTNPSNSCIAMALLLAAPLAHAQTPLYWNTNTTGTWGTGANWNSAADGSGTTGAPANSITTHSAVFNTSVANGATIAQLTAATSIQGITFNNTGTTAINTNGSANRALTIGAGGVTLSSGAGAVTFGTTTTNERVTFTLGADQTWTNNSSNALALNTNNTIANGGFQLTIDGSGGIGAASNGIRISGTGATVKNGNGNLLIAANTQSGNFTLNSGSVSVQTNTTGLGTGILKINGGSLSTIGGANRVLGNSSYEINGTFAVTGGATAQKMTFGTANGGNVSLVSSSTINVTGATITADVQGVISGSGFGLTKGDTGTLQLSAANSYTGATTITGGTLALGAGGSVASSSIIVGASTTFDVSAVTGGYALGSAQTLSGSGSVVGAMAVTGTLSPGSSPGTLSTGDQSWLNGGDYNWQILNATGTAGTGYDTISLTGALDLTNLTTGGFGINLWSISSTGPDVSGNALNFDNTLDQSWTILTASSGISGFSASKFLINVAAANGTAGFSNALDPDGVFSISQSGNNLLLNYTVVPEPTSSLLGLIGGGLLLLRRRRG